MPNEINPEQFLLGLNSLLPKDIRILKCESSSKDYQPIKDSISKEELKDKINDYYNLFMLFHGRDTITRTDIEDYLSK